MLPFTEVLILASITICIAGISGILSGIFGIGGGMFFVPAMNIFMTHYYPDFPQPMLIANNTSLSCIFLLNGYTLYRRYHDLSHSRWRLGSRMFFVILGAFLGSIAIRYIHDTLINQFFALYLVITGTQKICNPTPHTPVKTSFTKRYYPALLAPISFIASILGIGGAIFLFPLLLRAGYSKAQAAATSTLATICLAGITIAWTFTQPIPDLHSNLFIGDVFWPLVCVVILIAPFFVQIGLRIHAKHKKSTLNRILGGLLLIVAVLQFLH